MITVFHNKDFMSGEEIKASNLKKVAEVNTDNLEEAFQFTNSIECLWTENFAGGRLGTAFVEKCRSTSEQMDPIGRTIRSHGQKYEGPARSNRTRQLPR